MTRHLVVLLSAALLAGAVRADEEALKTLERAIKAHGGTSALEKMPTMVRTLTGTMQFNGMETAYTGTLTCDVPDRFRYDVEVGPQKFRLSVIVSKDRGWEVAGGLTQEMVKQRHEELQKEGYVLHLASLVPIRQGVDRNRITLKTLPEEKIRGKAVAVIQVSAQGKDDLKLAFDKETGLLVQISRRGSLAGFQATREYVFGEFKEFNGARLPTHYTEQLNGDRILEGKNVTYRFPRQVDEKVFQKP